MKHNNLMMTGKEQGLEYLAYYMLQTGSTAKGHLQEFSVHSCVSKCMLAAVSCKVVSHDGLSARHVWQRHLLGKREPAHSHTHAHVSPDPYYAPWNAAPTPKILAD